MLACLNSHARDARISFLESTHTYFIDGQKTDCSVTGFVKKNFQEFNADEVIRKMKQFGTFSKKYGNRSPAEVKQDWEDNRDRAANMGTRMHKYIEDFYNGLPLADEPDLNIEIQYFLNYLRDHQHLVPFRTEWYIFDERHRLAGCIDIVYQVGPGKVAIYDWKRSKEIKTSNRYGKGVGPLARMDDCNFNHYTLQLNVYKYILEKNYGLQVTEMKLVVLHPNNPNYLLYPVRNVQPEVEALLAERASALAQVPAAAQ